METQRGQGLVDTRQNRRLEAGEVLFRQGEPGDAAYVIETGLIEIYTEQGESRASIAHLGPNSILGEMALFGDADRAASAQALAPTQLLRLTADHLRERLEGAEPLTRHLLHVLVARCRELLERANAGPSPAGPAVQAPAAADLGSDRALAFGRLRAEQDIEQALADEQFQLHFQPILRFADQSVAGYEALIRWVKPDGSRVSPGDFIPVAEASELICRIGRWVVRVAVDSLLQLDQAQRQLQPGSPALFITVNLSARQLHDPELLPLLAAQAQRLQGRDCRLKIEVTESLMIGNVALMQAFIARCGELGLPVVLDDFGTGYCSLSYLHLFKVQTMKLDRSFVRGMAESPASEKVVRGIVAIAHDLGLDIVAEGIETEQQAAQAAAMGVDYAQGYHFGRPGPLAEAMAQLGQ
ncbi:MAG: EAL domain-containing protein [Stagnimonas sp.]|nr:EAL domain-containing protein [Stagnimonas sp.]